MDRGISRYGQDSKEKEADGVYPKYHSASVMDYGDLYTPSRIENASAAEGEKRVESFLESDGAKYLYLKSIGKAPEIKKKTAGFGTYSEFTIYPSIHKAFDGLSKKYKLEEEV